MKVGIYTPSGIPQSFKVYTENVLRGFEPGELEPVMFSGPADLPSRVDLLWDVRSGGGNPPPDFLLAPGLAPLVVTVHGFAPMSLPALEYYRSWRERIGAIGYCSRQVKAWARARAGIARVIAVSHFTRSEVLRLAGIDGDRIDVCWHGVDVDQFDVAPTVTTGRPYLLHVSNDEPRKNLARVVRAFGRLRRHADVDLLLKVPEAAAARYAGHDGVRVQGGHLSTEALAALYAGARGFVFPSLYEGFGLPILEAMAAGCPVITSTVTACPEVGAEPAYLVDPRDEAALEAAMSRLLDDPAVPDRVMQGRRRAAAFSWRRSAEGHLSAFRAALAHPRAGGSDANQLPHPPR